MNYISHFEQGIDYAQYLQDFERALALGDAISNHQYLPMNWQRVSRINKTCVLNEAILQALDRLSGVQNWLVITEHWCGDASQIVPVLAKMAEASHDKIHLRLIYRDAHLDLMDAHLTNGGRAIPKLLILDESNNLMGDWGPRPKEAQDMVIQLKSQAETAATYADHLHKWYAQNKQQAIQNELLEWLS